MKNPKSLQSVLDNFLGYPQLIYRRGRKPIVKTSKSMIEKGYVYVNGFTKRDVDYPVFSGDYVKFGMARKGEHFYVI